MNMSKINYTRDLFLLCMSAIYLAAFSSLYVQIPGLYGENGILPAKIALGEDSKEVTSWEDLTEGKPTLLKLTPMLGLSVEQGMDLLCVCGMLLSFLSIVLKPLRDTISFILLWMLYFSLYQVGQTFLWFQWDILLLETGFLTILVAPFSIQMPVRRLRMLYYRAHDGINLWLVRWLLFRLMFASGVVKLTSKCPTWWGLTALNWHFESQCIPTPLAWYFHHLPVWFLRLSVVATYVIEIAVPFLFFVPVRSLRLFAFWSQVMLQVLIIFTGNYNFFNLLTIVLCIPLLDDQFLGYHTQKKQTKIVDRLSTVAVLGYIGFQMYRQFSLTLADDFTIQSRIAFSKDDFDKFLAVVLPWTIRFGLFSLGFEILLALVRCFTEHKGTMWKIWAAVQTACFGFAAVSMFAISLVPFTTLHAEGRKMIPKQAFQLHKRLDDFQLVNSYGLFRHMTGVGGRPEVVIEGSNERDGGWREYEFFYKPGDLKRRPPIVAPHQPRLDWQMWFAALGSYQNNQWFVNLAYRLLTNQPEVLDLIQYNPFPDRPPKYIRANLYKYHYTNLTANPQDTTSWWTRELTGEYLPILTKDEKTLVTYIQHSGIITSKKKSKTESYTAQGVDWLRQTVGQPEGFVFVTSALLSAFTIQFVAMTMGPGRR